jgi:hypothetical protein
MFRLGRFQTLFALGIAAVALGMVQVPEAGAQPPSGWRPLALTGYNADVIVDKDPTVAFSVAFDGTNGTSGPPATGGCGWYESGATDAAGTTWDNGLPAGQTFESMTGSGAVYLVQPAVLNNILQVGATATGTLTLLTPAPYSQIAVISSSGNAGGTSVGTATINYADGTSDTAGYNTFDWCSSGNPASALPPQGSTLTTIDRNCPAGGMNAGKGSSVFTHSGCGPNANLYETIIPTNNTKNIVSVAFTAPADANWSGIFGISANQ